MFHRWAALLLVLALCAMSPKTAAGQANAQPPRGQKSGVFGKPFPNPFNPEVHIPFAVDTTGGCRDGSRQSVVTISISNILSQEVAVPILEDGVFTSTTSVPSSLIGASISGIKLGCGEYQAFWGGFVKGTHKAAASGVYAARIFIDGKLTNTVPMLIRK